MFGKLFGRRNRPAPVEVPSSPPANPGLAAVLQEIDRRRPTDPSIGVKLGSAELVQRLTAALKDERGVHAETLIGVLGSLAGFACVASVVAVAGGRDLKQLGIIELGGKDGNRYLYGSLVNAPLLGAAVNVNGLIWGMAKHLGAAAADSPKELLTHVADTVGSPSFGVPRLPAGHQIGIPPLEAVRQLWPATAKERELFCSEPSHWPVLYGLATQRAMEMAKATLDPVLAARIAMECAAPMSKLDPRHLPS
jgi:hypothetical protein